MYQYDKRTVKFLWTLNEITLLKTVYSNHSVEEIQKMLLTKYGSNRTIKAIKLKAHKLGIVKYHSAQQSWSVSEKLFLENNYSKLSKTSISKHLKRTPTSIYHFVSRNLPHLIDKNDNYSLLSDEDKNYIFDNYDKINISDIANHLSRSYTCIQRFFKKHNLVSKTFTYSEDDIKFIVDNVSKYTPKQLAEKLDKTASGVRKVIDRLELRSKSLIKKTKKHTSLSKEDEIKLLTIQSEHSVSSLSKIFKCSTSLIYSILKKNGIVKSKSNKFSKKDDENLKYYLSKNYPYEKIGYLMNRSVDNLVYRAIKLGINKRKK